MAITLQNVDFSYDGEKKVLDNLSFTLPKSGAVCLSGPSGCGKTTLLRLLAGLEKPQSGTITGISGIRVSYVFQENRLLPWMTALDNVAVAVGGAAGRQTASNWLDRVGLGSFQNKRPNELSGGMKRRIAIARALASPADLLVLDEPFVGLDPALWESISHEILSAYADKPIVLVTHITDQAKALNAHLRQMEGPPLRII